MFWRGLVIQWRVVGALLIREVYSRFGRESLRFARTVGEPLVFALPVLLIWRMTRAVFGTTVKTYGDPMYTACVLAVMTLFGLWLPREGRRYVMAE
jgi:ABC-type polysaccharide/polyol phosphate export permease